VCCYFPSYCESDAVADSGTRFGFHQVALPLALSPFLKKRRNHACCVTTTKSGYAKLYIYGGSYQEGSSIQLNDGELPFYVYDEKGMKFLLSSAFIFH
jgi:hypothetical protein